MSCPLAHRFWTYLFLLWLRALRDGHRAPGADGLERVPAHEVQGRGVLALRESRVVGAAGSSVRDVTPVLSMLPHGFPFERRYHASLGSGVTVASKREGRLVAS